MTDRSRVVAMDAFLAQWSRKFITAQWSTENTSCFNFFVYFFFKFCDPPRVSTRGIASMRLNITNLSLQPHHTGAGE